MIQDKNSKEIKWRDLTGPEKLKLFDKINIPDLFPTVPQATNVQKLWTDFLTMYKMLQSTEKVAADVFEDKARDWLTLFTSVYQTRHVTPYMHLLTCHVAEFLRTYGTIALFSQQGLEKLNDDVTKYYFRSTNHQDEVCLKQVLLKLNRLEELEDNGYGCLKLSYVCRNCKEIGHNSRTCKLKSKVDSRH